MTILKQLLLNLLFVVVIMNWSSAFADEHQSCVLEGTYGYVYNGTSYTPGGPISLTETGFFTIHESGNLSGEGTLAFYFADFGGNGPLWLLIHEVQSSGVVTPDSNDSCMGTADFVATGTVIKTSDPNLVPEKGLFYSQTPPDRSLTPSAG